MSNDDFAKLYRAEDVGQVLIVLDDGEDGPEVSISFHPKGLGVCALKLRFKDTDEGNELAEKAFSGMTEEKALGMVRNALSKTPFTEFAAIVA